MASSRPLLALAGGVLAIVLASLGGLAYLTLRTGPLAERLVREVDALARERHPRPSHVMPALPGTFAGHAAPLMEEAVRLYREQMELLGMADAPCPTGVKGQEQVSPLPRVCLDALARGRALMEQVLAATHAEDGGLPEGLGGLDSPKHPHAAYGRLALGHVVRLASLETRVRLEGGRAAEAVDTCLDALALSRELALGGGLMGHMLSAAGYDVMYRPCAEALDAAPVERKRSAVSQLSRLAEGLAPFSRTLREESASVQLEYYGGMFPRELLGTLPAGARDVALAAPGEALGPVDTRLSWRRTVKLFDALEAVADLEAESRRRAFQAVAAEEAAALYSVEGPEVAAYERYADRAERLRFQHDALTALLEADLERARTGHWPAHLTTRGRNAFALESAGPAKARLEPCASARTEYGLRVTADAPSGTWVRQKP